MKQRIEKLKEHLQPEGGYDYRPWEIPEKLNEVIDFLNNQGEKEPHYPALCDIGCKECKTHEIKPQPIDVW